MSASTRCSLIWHRLALIGALADVCYVKPDTIKPIRYNVLPLPYFGDPYGVNSTYGRIRQIAACIRQDSIEQEMVDALVAEVRTIKGNIGSNLEVQLAVMVTSRPCVVCGRNESAASSGYLCDHCAHLLETYIRDNYSPAITYGLIDSITDFEGLSEEADRVAGPYCDKLLELGFDIDTARNGLELVFFAGLVNNPEATQLAITTMEIASTTDFQMAWLQARFVHGLVRGFPRVGNHPSL